MYGMRENFYRNPELKAMPVDSASQIERYLQANHPESIYLVDREGFKPTEKIDGYQSQLVYCYFPSWISKLNLTTGRIELQFGVSISLPK